MSASALFNETYYLTNNADVVVSISQGNFGSAFAHYNAFGGKELRQPNSTFNPQYYAVQNSDVLNAVAAGTFTNVFSHYQEFGEKENRAPSTDFATFDAAAYLAANSDIAAAVTAGTIGSALDHFITFGQSEGRAGSGVAAVVANGSTFTLTTGVDTFVGTDNNDTFIGDNTGATATVSSADSLTGGTGTDTLQIFSAGAAPAVPTLSSIETLTIFDQDANFAMNVNNFLSVTTVNLIRSDGIFDLTIGANAASISIQDIVLSGAGGDDGIGIIHTATDTATIMEVNGITAANADADENISIVGAALATLDLSSAGTATTFDNFDAAAVATFNITANANLTLTGTLATSTTSGTINLSGASNVDLSALDAGINTINAGDFTGNFTGEIGTAVDTVLTSGSGDDVITASTTDTIATSDALAVDAGAGTDVLVVGDAADIASAGDAARYTNFETLRVGAAQNMSLVAGITAIQHATAINATLTNVSQAQLSDITFSADNGTATTYTGASVTGSSDAAVINLTSGTATSNVDLTSIGLAGIETVTFNATTGTNGTESDIAFGANLSDAVSSIIITGSADVQLDVSTNTLDVVAVSIDASAITGTGDFELAGNGANADVAVLLAGSSVTGSDGADTIALSSTTGVTYAGGAGNDTFRGTVADIQATGTNDSSVDGGAGTTDTIRLDDAAPTLADSHFTNISNMEVLTLASATGNTSVTTGGSFNSAFSDGVTITTGTLADTSAITVASGLSNVDMTITVVSNDDGSDTAGNSSIVTGSGADTITYTAASFATFAGAATQAINAGAGNDTITYTHGTLGNVNATTQAFTITGGAGADTISKTGTNGNDAETTNSFVFANGDSVIGGFDKITGYDITATGDMADELDFVGTAAVGTLASSTDASVIKSHAISNGVATFDDAGTHSTALIISSASLADVGTYLASNTATNDVVAFQYDDNGDGANDGTMVYHNGATDSFVLLAGELTANAVVATNANNIADDIFIL
jgi:hypothetical protein